MCFLMSKSFKGASESNEISGRQDESRKKGICLFELRHSGMVQWGTYKQVATLGPESQNEENGPPQTMVVKEEQKDGDDAAVKVESLAMPEIRKGKRHTLSELREAGASKRLKQEKNDTLYTHKQIKHENSKPSKKGKSKPHRKENFVDRWSTERYNLAEEKMLEVMKAEGAVIENPISRSKLRMAARAHIGDTGLLDHLLKHIDGKVAPGGTERFRRVYNTDGVMEYWLESADLIKVKREAGLSDVSWVPPSWYKPSGVIFQDSVCSAELTLLKEEMAKMKSDMEVLASRNKEQDHTNPIEEMHKELVKWRNQIDQRMTEISTSLGTMQNMYRELVTWKSKTEQQLTEISNSLSSMQASRQPALSPLSDWEGWLESTNLDNIQGEEFAPFIENPDLINARPGQGLSMHEPCTAAPQPWLMPCDSLSRDPKLLKEEMACATELEQLKEEMARMKRDVQELIPKMSGEDQANITPDSSATANSKLDLDNSFILFQEMLKELVKWKAKMEQQMMEISNSVCSLQASKQHII